MPKFGLRRSLPIMIPCQPWEHELASETSKKDVWWQYFPLNNRLRRQLGLEMILQLCLASNASLKDWMSRRPIPPSRLYFVNLDHATQHILRFSGLESHQKCVNTDWILLHRLWGNLKHNMEYVGIYANTDLMMVIFPALDMNFEE